MVRATTAARQERKGFRMISWGRFAALAALASTAFALLGGSASAATVTVNSTADETPAVLNGLCSIREAIEEAQANGPDLFNPDCDFNETQPFGDDTINIPAGTYTLSGASGDNQNDTGDLDITLQAGNGLSFVGAGASTIIDANDNDRVIHFFGTGTGSLSDLTLTDGTAPAVEGGGGLAVSLGSTVTASGLTVSGNATASTGGGVLNSGTLTISGSSITGNTTATSAVFAGAGISSSGTTSIDSSSVSGNSVTSPDDASDGSGVDGGGVLQRNGATLTVTDSTISGNVINSLDPTKHPSGAGIAVIDANLVLRRSALSGNISGGGSGAAGGALGFLDIAADNTLTIENSTFSGNAASSASSVGGAIRINKGLTKIANATFTNNTATFGRAIFWNKQGQADSSVTLRGTLLQENGTDECSAPQGPLTSAGHNIDRGTSCALATGTDQQSTTATLSGLANNGGPTQTHAISGAVAVDDIPAAQCFDTTGTTLLSTDQRGVQRPQGTDCDVGAYELGPTCSGQASTIIGTGTGETINGTSGPDVIVAGGGADIVNGGDGADAICGGDGNDTIRTGQGADSDAAFGEGETDTASFDDLSAGLTSANLATGTTSGTDSGVDSMTGFENLTGTPFDDQSGSTGLTGNAGQNTIDGGDGNDIVQGLADNDTLIGGGGSEDTATWISLGPVTANLTDGTATGVQGSDTLSGFENLTGSSGTDTLVGNASANDLNGFSDNDVMDGRGNNDFLTGGPGSGDTASFSGLPGPVSATLNVGALSATGQGNDSGNTIENLTGSPDGDTLTGDGLANTLNGTGGDDTLADGVTTIANPDTYAGGDGTDRVSYAARTTPTADVTVNLNGTADNGGEGGENDDLGADVEGAIGGAGQDNLIGDDQANPLSGGDNEDVLDGRGAADAIAGDGDFDAATYLNLPGPVTANLATGLASGAQGADSLSSLENLVGSPNGDTLTGNATGNVLFGGTGDDTLDGRESQDNLEGGNDTDTASFAGLPSGVQATLTAGTLSATGGQGNDSGTSLENLTGSDAADTLTGDDNANVITGGLGADIVFANAGPDALLIRDGVGDTADCGSDADTDTVETDQQGSDTLTNCGSDTIQFPSAPPPPGGGGPISPPAPQGSCAGRTLTLTGTEGNDTITGTAAADVIAALGGNDTVRGLAGNDVVCGGTGNDRLIGGAGNDRLLGEAGKDTLKGSAGRDNCSGAGGRDTAATCERRRSVP
jgi:CSLREA domain-containing protein